MKKKGENSMEKKVKSLNDALKKQTEVELEERLEEELEERVEFACWTDCTCNGDHSK